MRSLPLVLSALVLVAAGACSGEETPPAEDVIPEAAEAMAELESLRFDLAVEGDVEGLSVKTAEGVVTADSAAEGTGTITALGMDLEVEYVILGPDAYVKGPTGGHQRIPVGDEMLPYDPTILLAPDRGIPALLEAVDSAEPQDTDVVSGFDTYRYAVVFEPSVFADFIPAEGNWNEATVWFDQETARVVKAEFTQGDAVITMLLSDFDDQVTIEAP
ncbi:LppX_LprAFG lipoprotein [Glycomyces sp. A-F 0318]|uniref:LppX_LprAFG lipoprotein n=1 Tax=Glycomyces amatae TaxID=2881355 RepID=UPI001E3E8F87|nr:LppX_LprAFG lipoprotein [Glycomyces amatae]MCD0445624.1 LppX_LprAFG lipoprotein [Glycomyces amatae]